MKPKPPKKKHQRKSPVTAVIVEPTAPPECVTESPSESIEPLGTPLPSEPKEVRKQTVKTLAETLEEPKEKRGQLAVIVKHLGSEAALRLLKETQEIEAQGGMMTLNDERRRTAGGVFFALVRTRHPDCHFRPIRCKKKQEGERAFQAKQPSSG